MEVTISSYEKIRNVRPRSGEGFTWLSFDTDTIGAITIFIAQENLQDFINHLEAATVQLRGFLKEPDIERALDLSSPRDDEDVPF